MVKIGIPRGLHYYRYFPAIRAFFEALSAEVIVSPPTTRATVSDGIALLVAETCLPVKVYAGQVMHLRNQVDFVFVPSIKSVEKNLYNCVKLFALPDQIRAMPDVPPVLDMLFDVNTGEKAVYKELYSIGKHLKASRSMVDRAAEKALRAYQEFDVLLHRGLTPLQAMEALDGHPTDDLISGPGSGPSSGPGRDDLPPDAPRVALVGHPYSLYDEYINHNILKRLADLGVRVLTMDAASQDELSGGINRIVGSPYWMNEKEITGAAGHYIYSNSVDGVMIVTVFGCGPDSMMIDAAQRAARRAGGGAHPLFTVILDEHTAETGLVTRLEAFVDTLQRRKASSFDIQVPETAAAPNVAKFGKDMRLAFPHMGTVHVALEVLFSSIGIQHVVPPPCSKRSLDLAAKYSPEWACVPYKLTLGNFIEAIEAGANSVLLLKGPNNCRFGYYQKLQDHVLRDLGYKYQWVLPEISGRSISGVAEILRDASGRQLKECWSAVWLTLDVQRSVDAIERKVQYVRARELRKGTANSIWEQALVEMAAVRSSDALKAVRRKYEALLDAVPMDLEHEPVRICIVGEIYVVQEPYINQDIEVELGKMGVEANRSEQISQWLSLFPGVILDRIGLGHNARIQRSERPYLQYWSGETIGQTVMADEDGYDGVIQLAPFTCTPEVVAQNVLPKLRKDIDIPVLTLILDEQTARTGIITRLEAFVDLLQRRGDGRPRRRRSHTLGPIHLPPLPSPFG